MIGNDVIDLSLARLQSNWRRRGFIDKICSDDEKQFICSSENPDTMVWTLWSMKEAAYKAWNRKSQTREYAPSKIHCSIVKIGHDQIMGSARYYGSTYMTSTELSDDYIHTSAQEIYSTRQPNKILIKNYPTDYQTYLSQKDLLPERTIIMKDARGLPSLCSLSTNEKRPVSISHHGIFLGLAYMD